MAADRVLTAPPTPRTAPTSAVGDDDERAEFTWRPLHPFTAAVRLSLLVLVAVLSMAATRDPATLVWAGLLAIIAIPAVAAPGTASSDR